MILLQEALPILVLDLESALAHLGRGKVADQLRAVVIERWTYDENADTAYVHFRPPSPPEGAAQAGETVSVYDELGINLDIDSQGRLTGMEIQGAGAIVAQLERDPTSPQSP
jgi:uncharacterized protein YuzE